MNKINEIFENLDDSHENWENQWNYQRKTKVKEYWWKLNELIVENKSVWSK